MRAVLLVLVLAIMAPGAAGAADSVVIGRALSNADTYIELACPENSICMDTWILWVISADQTLAGPQVHGRIRAVRIQHTTYIDSYLRQLRLFVLKPIEDAESRALFHADYYLQDVSAVHQMYCIDHKPADIGVKADDVFARSDAEHSKYCFEIPKETD